MPKPKRAPPHKFQQLDPPEAEIRRHFLNNPYATFQEIFRVTGLQDTRVTRDLISRIRAGMDNEESTTKPKRIPVTRGPKKLTERKRIIRTYIMQHQNSGAVKLSDLLKQVAPELKITVREIEVEKRVLRKNGAIKRLK
ncbi:MAG: hypothetical protein J4224_00210 [Candidatus Diapherotrites archaeon]|uniref:Uncharacterized protein n=2 Tax=Candidatus Iainarchaeum sp. TaxID=3101447 RepID=A0A8T4KUX1_9ARCH|nr:MAG: hypothetical protein QT03_C0001G1081 [archaeon GW2011_AR10]MBS3058833.1 hypothetical protein [Candidatus Diapherotrites archaeon]